MLENLEKGFSSILDKNTYQIKFEDDNFKVSITPNSLYKVVKALKDNDKLKFSQLLELTAVDYPDRAERFNLVYIFFAK